MADEAVTSIGFARVKFPVAERMPPPKVRAEEPVPRLRGEPAERAPAEMRVPPL